MKAIVHTHEEKFTWKKHRPHNQPPRVHVKCSLCGEEFQSIPVDGKIVTVFRTNRPMVYPRKILSSLRLTEAGWVKLRRMIRDGEIA